MKQNVSFARNEAECSSLLILMPISQMVQSSEECITELMTKLSIPTKKGLKLKKTPRPRVRAREAIHLVWIPTLNMNGENQAGMKTRLHRRVVEQC